MDRSQAPDAAELQDLLRRTAAGERAAFAALYRRTSGKLYGVIMRILSRPAWSEEVMQETYLRIWRRAAAYRPERGAAMTWMISIARHAAIDRLRRDRGEVSAEAVPGLERRKALEPDPLATAMNAADARALSACLAELDETQRRCIVLAYVEGYTHAELSEATDSPIGTVKSWIRRGLARLKTCLER